MRKVFSASLSAVAVLLILVLASAPARAQGTITFDDLTVTNPPVGNVVLNGYQGLDWNNFYVLNTTTFSSPGPNGYANGTVSGPNVVYNFAANPATISGTPFTFNSAYFNAAWNNGLSITINGLLNGTLVDTATFVVDATGPATLETFDWADINELDFSASGGTSAGYSWAGTTQAGSWFAMDNLTINGPVATPEPGSFTLLGVGLLGLARLLSTKRLLA